MAGCVYILTNKSFPDLVKIGYESNVRQYVRQLNRESSVPYDYIVFATYEVENKHADAQLHKIINMLNPTLKVTSGLNRLPRRNGFFKLSPTDAYAILEAIAEIHGCKDRLTREQTDRGAENTPSNNTNAISTVQLDTTPAQSQRSSSRLPRINLLKLGISVGETIVFTEDPSKTATVIDKSTVRYNGRKYKLSQLANLLLNKSGAIQGPRYFMYNGERLTDLRSRLGV